MNELGRNYVRGQIRSFVGLTSTGYFIFEHMTREPSKLGKSYDTSGLVPTTNLIAVAPREIFDVYDRPQLWEKSLHR